VVSPSTPRGTRSARLFSHYSLLATAEQLLRLRRLGQAATAATMTTAFRLQPALPQTDRGGCAAAMTAAPQGI
jgi:hypothetical protein